MYKFLNTYNFLKNILKLKILKEVILGIFIINQYVSHYFCVIMHGMANPLEIILEFTKGIFFCIKSDAFFKLIIKSDHSYAM